MYNTFMTIELCVRGLQTSVVNSRDLLYVGCCEQELAFVVTVRTLLERTLPTTDTHKNPSHSTREHATKARQRESKEKGTQCLSLVVSYYTRSGKKKNLER